MPSRATAGSAGADLSAALDGPATIPPGGRLLVPTGFAWEIPPGYEGQVRPRSGLALRSGLTCLNAPGTVDSDYRGEVCVLLVNLGPEPFLVERGMRVAQLLLAPVPPWEAVESPELDGTGAPVGSPIFQAKLTITGTPAAIHGSACARPDGS